MTGPTPTPEAIILACTHMPPGSSADVRLGSGRYVACCSACFNASVYARRGMLKANREAAKAEGIRYWASRGIRVGDTVQRFAQSMFGIGGVPVHGIAKVGACGAYVSSSVQRGYLAPEGWSPVEQEQRGLPLT
jgi:hypothetical protein